MAFCISIDRLDANIEEITVGRWLKKEGDPVALGEPVVEIITDKITFEYEAEAEGILAKIVAPEKSVVPVHYIIGVIAQPGEELPDYEAHNAELMEALREKALGPAARERREIRRRPAGPRGRVRATPAARRRARELGVDLAQVAEKVNGPISAQDVERFAAGEL